MIKTLQIENFKSIKHLKLDCRRINILIGEPNTGKSNMLEALGLLSHIQHGQIRPFIRFENMRDLFYDQVLDNAIKIGLDEKTLELAFKDGRFNGVFFSQKTQQSSPAFQYDYYGSGSKWNITEFSNLKFYRFIVRENYSNQKSDFLLPPNGDNLLAAVLARKDLRATVKQIFDRFGLALVFEPHEGKIKVQKQLEDIIVAFPYSLASETLQRLVFYLTAIHSNKDAILTFEEPEAHAFPYYTKYLAEIIALNKNDNQYFMSTHNPYFLLSILEKTPKNEVAVFLTHLENYQTKVKALTEDDIKEVLEKGTDVFFNIERFLP